MQNNICDDYIYNVPNTRLSLKQELDGMLYNSKSMK